MASKRSELFLPLLGVVIGGLIVATGNWLVTNREMNVKMVEIAVGILSQEPKDNIAPAREWAVDVISKYAGVELSAEVRKALVEGKALSGFWTSFGGSSGMIGTMEDFAKKKGPQEVPDREVIVPPSP